MSKLSEEKRKARARERFVVRHAADIESVLFAVSVLRGLRDRMNARHEEGDVGGAAFYANGALNAVDSLLDKQPRIDDIRPCTHCVATGRDDAGAPCFICQGKGERVLGSPWPDPKTGLPAEASDE